MWCYSVLNSTIDGVVKLRSRSTALVTGGAPGLMGLRGLDGRSDEVLKKKNFLVPTGDRALDRTPYSEPLY